MKKLLVGLLAIVLLTGCSHKNKDTTFMLTRDDQFYACLLYTSPSPRD